MVKFHVVVLHPKYGVQGAGGVYKTKREAKARLAKVNQILDMKVYTAFIQKV